MTRTPTIAVATGLALAILTGCEVGGNGEMDVPGEPAAAALEDSMGGFDEGSPGVGESEGMPGTPLVLGRGGVPVEELELRTYALRLVNGTERPAVLYADAGAERVVLDTIGPLDSTRVNVEVRAREMTLHATDLAGRPVTTDTIAPRADSLTRWEIRG